MEKYLTCAQVAKRLRISISTLKRWVNEPELNIEELRNKNGWRLFSEEDVITLKEYKKKLKRRGKKYSEKTLVPINGQKKEQKTQYTHSSNIHANA
jgi:DNA-binding transcriptional MerR regulator